MASGTKGLAGFVSGCILGHYRTAFYSPAGGNKIDKILSDKDPICSSASNHDSPVLRACTKSGGWGIKMSVTFILNIIRHQLCTMNDRHHIDLIRLYAVNDPV